MSSAPRETSLFSGSAQSVHRKNLTGTTLSASHSPAPVGEKAQAKTPSPSTVKAVNPATATVLATTTKPLTGTPVAAVASGPEWKAVVGSTLKESLTDWAGRADCPGRTLGGYLADPYGLPH
ncbi:toxin co-regulated pilus biosynthesis Q family protein [Salmonella sp. WGH-01]|nr:toxin co-regulated pilus biosynthesis Q family protein [Salmonella sp. WGH-01]